MCENISFPARKPLNPSLQNPQFTWSNQ